MQTIEAKYVLDGSQAMRTLTALQAQEDRLAASTGAMATSLARADSTLRAYAATSTAASTATKNLDTQMRALGGNDYDRRLDAVAASMRRVESAAGRAGGSSMSAGQATLEAARAYEDLQYGIAGVVNNIPGLVMALGAGAGVAGAASVAAVAGSKLYAVWKEAQANADVFKEAVAGIGPTVTRLAREAIDPTREAVKGLLADLRNFGKDARQITIDEGVDSLAKLEEQKARLERNIFGARRRADAARFQGKGDLEAAEAIVKQLERRLAELPQQIDETRGLIDRATRATLEIDAKGAQQQRDNTAADAAKDAAKKRQEMEAQAEVDAFRLRVERDRAARDAELRAIGERKQLALDALKARHDAEEREERETQRERERLAREHEAERKRIAKEAADERARIAREEAQANAAAATAALSIVTAASQQLIADLVTGQEHAAERFAVAIMQQAGQALISYGTQAFGRGILEASSPVTAPLAPASFAASAALITGGLALGGVAAGIGAGLGGGGGGRAARDTGGPSTGRASSSAAPTDPKTTEFNVYFGGPPLGRARENVAIDVAETERLNRRRGRRGRP